MTAFTFRSFSLLSMLPWAITAAVSLSSAALAADFSNSDVVDAIIRAKVLAPSTHVNARVDDDKVLVALYRNRKASEDDCKIDAVLIAKAVMNLSDSLAKVTVRFYSQDLPQYAEVSVTAGDVKAFGMGKTGNEQLLSSLTLETKQVADNADKITRQLHSASYVNRTDYKISFPSPDAVDITTNLGAWVPDEECKLDALKLAEHALTALPAGVSKVTVSFLDPYGSSDTRQVSFRAGALEDTWRNVQSAMSQVVVAKQAPALDIQSLKVSAGPAKEAREKLLARLKDLDKKGIGVVPFARAFMGIEQLAAGGDEAKITDAVNHLNDSLDAQEKAYKAAKESRISKSVKPAEPPKAGAAPASRWAAGDLPIIEGEVLGDPSGVVRSQETHYVQGFKRADDNPRFLIVLDQVARILRQNNRAGDATAFETRASAMRARGIK
jgi:hypothetical protein